MMFVFLCLPSFAYLSLDTCLPNRYPHICFIHPLYVIELFLCPGCWDTFPSFLNWKSLLIFCDQSSMVPFFLPHPTLTHWASLVAQTVKRLPTVGDPGSIPGLGRFPGEGNDNPLQYACLDNPMDGGTWLAIVHGVAKSWTRLSDFTLTFTI